MADSNSNAENDIVMSLDNPFQQEALGNPLQEEAVAGARDSPTSIPDTAALPPAYNEAVQSKSSIK